MKNSDNQQDKGKVEVKKPRKTRNLGISKEEFDRQLKSLMQVKPPQKESKS